MYLGLPVRFNMLYCAALRLRDHELAYPLPAKQRGDTPLFCMEPGTPFAHHLMAELLLAIKDLIMPEVEDKSVFTCHSFRFVSCWRPSWGSQDDQARRYKRCAGGSPRLRSRSM